MVELSGQTTDRERELLGRLDASRLPAHVAIIMDGNGRWARRKTMERVFGHRAARRVVRETVETSRRVGVRCLTLFAFSTENWKRPAAEVAALMLLLQKTIEEEVPELHRNGIRVVHVGERDRLPDGVREALAKAEALTAENRGMTLALAINYGGRREILLAARRAAEAARAGALDPERLLDEAVFEGFLQTTGMPPVDLMIRTAGELRISNFLLWGLAYAELHFTEVLWPDFARTDLLEAFLAYQARERRFGTA